MQKEVSKAGVIILTQDRAVLFLGDERLFVSDHIWSSFEGGCLHLVLLFLLHLERTKQRGLGRNSAVEVMKFCQTVVVMQKTYGLTVIDR